MMYLQRNSGEGRQVTQNVPEGKRTTPGKHWQPVIPSSNSTSSFIAALNKRRKTLMWTNHRLKSRRKSTTLSPYSPALSTLKSLLILCIRHMQSQCAPRHLRDTTVFPFYNWKMAFLLNKKAFFFRLIMCIHYFLCFDVVLTFYDQRKSSVVFLKYFFIKSF